MNVSIRYDWCYRRLRATFRVSRLMHVLALTSHFNMLTQTCHWPGTVWTEGVHCVSATYVRAAILIALCRSSCHIPNCCA